MKIRSKALYAYLLEAGVLDGTPEEIDSAKCNYRRKYKRQWKQQKRPRKEIRFEVTLKQFKDIKMKAIGSGVTHTEYARKVLLTAAESDLCIPNKKRLLQVLQVISMAAIASAGNTLPPWQLSEQLAKAEDMLWQYLKA